MPTFPGSNLDPIFVPAWAERRPTKRDGVASTVVADEADDGSERDVTIVWGEGGRPWVLDPFAEAILPHLDGTVSVAELADDLRTLGLPEHVDAVTLVASIAADLTDVGVVADDDAGRPAVNERTRAPGDAPGRGSALWRCRKISIGELGTNREESGSSWFVQPQGELRKYRLKVADRTVEVETDVSDVIAWLEASVKEFGEPAVGAAPSAAVKVAALPGVDNGAVVVDSQGWVAGWTETGASTDLITETLVWDLRDPGSCNLMSDAEVDLGPGWVFRVRDRRVAVVGTLPLRLLQIWAGGRPAAGVESFNWAGAPVGLSWRRRRVVTVDAKDLGMVEIDGKAASRLWEEQPGTGDSDDLFWRTGASVLLEYFDNDLLARVVRIAEALVAVSAVPDESQRRGALSWATRLACSEGLVGLEQFWKSIREEDQSIPRADDLPPLTPDSEHGRKLARWASGVGQLEELWRSVKFRPGQVDVSRDLVVFRPGLHAEDAAGAEERIDAALAELGAPEKERRWLASAAATGARCWIGQEASDSASTPRFKFYVQQISEDWWSRFVESHVDRISPFGVLEGAVPMFLAWKWNADATSDPTLAVYREPTETKENIFSELVGADHAQFGDVLRRAPWLAETDRVLPILELAEESGRRAIYLIVNRSGQPASAYEPYIRWLAAHLEIPRDEVDAAVDALSDSRIEQLVVGVDGSGVPTVTVYSGAEG